MARGRRQQPPTTIEVGFTEPTKEGDTYRSILSAIARCGRRPEIGVLTQFYLDHQAFDTPISTDSAGRATLEVYNLSPRGWRVGAQIVGTAIKAETTMQIREEIKKIDEPQVRAEGDEGDYLISVSVPLEKGRPAVGVALRFLYSPLGKPARHEDKLTDEHGFALVHLEFQEPECDVTVQVGGYEKEIKNLQGPSPWRKPRPYKRPSDDELKQGSLWDVICRAWRRGAEDAKGE